MNIMSKAASVAAGVSVAVLALSAAAVPAQAQSRADDVHIRVADLNLHSPEGRARAEARIAKAAELTCPGIIELDRHRACIDAFRAAAEENLAAQMQRLADQQGAAEARR
jgi:UrcA family protein